MIFDNWSKPLFFLVGIVLIEGCAHIGLLEEPPKLVDEKQEYQFTVGLYDTLSVIVWQNEELSVEAVVRPDGKISVPLIGEMIVLDKTPLEIESEIAKTLDRFIKAPKITVIIKEIKSLAFFVVGKIRNPGRYPLYKDISVWEGVAMAGGFAEFADLNRIFVQRRVSDRIKRYRFDFDVFLSGENLTLDHRLRSGDIIIVP